MAGRPLGQHVGIRVFAGIVDVPRRVVFDVVGLVAGQSLLLLGDRGVAQDSIA